MLNFIARRLLMAMPVLLGVSILVFLVLYLIPGDPAEILLFGSTMYEAKTTADGSYCNWLRRVRCPVSTRCASLGRAFRGHPSHRRDGDRAERLAT